MFAKWPVKKKIVKIKISFSMRLGVMNLFQQVCLSDAYLKGVPIKKVTKPGK